MTDRCPYCPESGECPCRARQGVQWDGVVLGVLAVVGAITAGFGVLVAFRWLFLNLF